MASKGCTAEANGTTLTCACEGCGILYNHATGKYTVLCCGAISEFKMKAEQQPDPPKRPKDLIDIDLVGCTRLEAARLLGGQFPGKIELDSSLESLEKRVTFKGTFTLAELTKKLALRGRATQAR